MLHSSPFRSAVGGIAAAALLNASFAPFVMANLPTGAQVVHGNVAITQAGGTMNIQQASRNAIVNWQSFNIGVGNSVRIEQGGADAAMLARVVGGDASQLLGSLKADGKLFLINQRGVIIGEGAVIDTAGFVGSTLDVTDAEFLAGGAMTFKGSSNAGILNLGTITAREGNVMLFAHSVKNAGEIKAWGPESWSWWVRAQREKRGGDQGEQRNGRSWRRHGGVARGAECERFRDQSQSGDHGGKNRGG